MKSPLLWLRVALILAAVGLSAAIAATTIVDAHPDEMAHLDAFRYFETHWQRPPLGSHEVFYSAMGWSRVFTGEIVYLLYGKVGRLARLVAEVKPLYIYRFLNVALLAGTLALLMSMRCRWCELPLVAVVMIAIPQVSYVYSYANSDAWGTSCAVLLFAQTAMLIDHPPRAWSYWRLAPWMLNLLLLLLSKVGFLLGLVMPLALLAVALFRQREVLGLRWYVSHLLLPLLAVALLAATWDPNLRPSRRHWREQLLIMREQVAVRGFKPSNPTHQSIYLASKGQTYASAIHASWFRDITQSFYSRFGGFQVHHPDWVFAAATALGLAALILTIIAAVRWRARLRAEMKACLLLSPLVIALNFYGALWHALHIDCQAQGRYLFPSLVAVYFLCAATVKIEAPRYRQAHLLLLAIAVALSIYSLIAFAIVDPTMRETPFWQGLSISALF